MSARRVASSHKPMDRHALSEYYSRKSLSEADQDGYDDENPTSISGTPLIASPKQRNAAPAIAVTPQQLPLSGAQQVRENYRAQEASPPAPGQPLAQESSPRPAPAALPNPELPRAGPSSSGSFLAAPEQPRSNEKGRSPWRKSSKPSGIAGALVASGMGMAHPSSPPMMPMRVPPTPASTLQVPTPASTPGSAIRRTASQLFGQHRRTLSNPTSDDVDSSDSDTDDTGRVVDEDAMPVTGFAVASSKRNVEFHELFPQVPPDDYLIEDYGCALQREILVQGRIYISENHLAFYSSIFGWTTSEVIPLASVVGIEKKMTAMFIPNAIQILTDTKAFTFASFMGRDTAFEVMYNSWRLTRPLNATSSRPSLDNPDLTVTTESAGPVRRVTTCVCGDSRQHYPTVCMDTVFPGTPEKIYNLLFASGFVKDFLRGEQRLLDLQISDWEPATAGSHLLTRNMSYIKPLSAPIGPKQTRCELRDEMLQFDLERHITMLTTTRTPEVPSGGSFSVKSRTCLTWAGACATRVVVTSSVEWTGSSLIKGIITSSAMEGQRKYYNELEPCVRKHIEEHRTEFVPEGMQAEPEPDILATPVADSMTGQGALPDEHDARWLQWALDTFKGASSVAQQSFTSALELLRDVTLDTKTVLLFVLVFLVVTNIALLLAARGSTTVKYTPPAERGELGDTLRLILDEIRKPANVALPPPPPPRAPTVLDWKAEKAEIIQTLDSLAARMQQLRQAIREDL